MVLAAGSFRSLRWFLGAYIKGSCKVLLLRISSRVRGRVRRSLRKAPEVCASFLQPPFILGRRLSTRGGEPNRARRKDPVALVPPSSRQPKRAAVGGPVGSSAPSRSCVGFRESGWPLRRDPLPLESNQPGVFVAGDVRHGSVKRVANAVGEGSMAIKLINQHRRLSDDEKRRADALPTRVFLSAEEPSRGSMSS